MSSNVQIHSTAILEGEVEIGEGTVIGPYCWIKGPVRIGERCRISAHVLIGGEPEHRSASGSGPITIGNDTILRENTVIHRGTGERPTQIGSRCYFMAQTHVSHDCLIEDDVTLAHNTVLAGHCKVLRGATTGIGTLLHQWSTLGSYTMTGMGAVITKDVPPFCLVKGNPARLSRLNHHAFAKAGLEAADVQLESGELKTQSPKVREMIARFMEFSTRKRVCAVSLPTSS